MSKKVLLRFSPVLVVSFLLSTIAFAQETPTPKQISPEDARELVRRAMESDLENYRKQRDLTHIERVKTDQLDKKGKLKKSETVTREILILYGERVERVLERDDKPLTGNDLKKEQERFEKRVAKLQSESPAEREKRQKKFEEQTEKSREFVREVADAFNFRFSGEEMVMDRPAYVIEAEPRPDYKPHSREGNILKKTRGRIWIDMVSNHWLKLDVEFTDTVSFGWFLARVRRGTRVQMEQALFRDEIWVPRRLQFSLDARVALFKELFANVDVSFRDWRKFSTDSKITDFVEVPPASDPKP